MFKFTKNTYFAMIGVGKC